MISQWIKSEARSQSGVLQNALWLLSDKVFKALCMLLTSSLLARHFGPDSYGQIAYTIAFIAIFQSAANLGLDAITVRDLSLDRDHSHEIIGTVFGLRLMTGAILWPLASFIGFALGPNENDETLLIWLAGGILLFQATDSIDLWFQSQGQTKKSVVAKMMTHLTGIALRLYMLYLNCPLWFFAAMIAVDAALLSFSLTQIYKRSPIGKKWQFKADRALALLREGWPFMLSGIAILVYARIDQIMINNLLGDHDLGIYSVALLISGFFAIIPVSICTAVAPYIAKQKMASHSRYVRTIKILNLLFIVLAITISVLVYALSNQIIHFLFGRQYYESADILEIHILSNIPLFLGVAQGLWIVNERRGRIHFYKTFSGAALCVGLNFIFVPRFGVSAAAAIAVMTQLFSSVISNILWDRDYLKIQIDIILNPLGSMRLR